MFYSIVDYYYGKKIMQKNRSPSPVYGILLRLFVICDVIIDMTLDSIPMLIKVIKITKYFDLSALVEWKNICRFSLNLNKENLEQ